jgi:ferrous iron transport protein B
MIILMWFLSAIPVNSGASHTNSFAHVDSAQNSVIGAVSTAISPVFKFTGFDDWHASQALVNGFVAKEVVIGTFSQSYANSPATASRSLSQNFEQTFSSSSDGHPQAAAAAFMVFLLAYTPCVATLVELRRQFGRKLAVESVGIGLVVAYVLAVVVFQIGRLL